MHYVLTVVLDHDKAIFRKTLQLHSIPNMAGKNDYYAERSPHQVAEIDSCFENPTFPILLQVVES